MTGPLVVTVVARCPVEHAFAIWTERIDTWWPRDHTVSGRDDARLGIEPFAGGRLLERLPDGTEHVWGEVTRWDPPQLLVYRWHIGQDPAMATDVSVSFAPAPDGGTEIRIEHRGWETYGEAAEEWRDRNRGGWDGLLPAFTDLAEREETR